MFKIALLHDLTLFPSFIRSTSVQRKKVLSYMRGCAELNCWITVAGIYTQRAWQLWSYYYIHPFIRCNPQRRIPLIANTLPNSPFSHRITNISTGRKITGIRGRRYLLPLLFVLVSLFLVPWCWLSGLVFLFLRFASSIRAWL